MSTFFIKQHDTLPEIAVTLLRPSGAPVDLTAAVSARLLFRLHGGGTPVARVATIEAPRTSGRLRYAWVDEDTEAAGVYDLEWEVTWSLGRLQTFPNASYDALIVTADID